MRIRKSLSGLVLAMTVAMVLASPAMATDGVIRDVAGTEVVKSGTEMHMISFGKFETEAGSYECHTTGTVKATGATGSEGEVTSLFSANTELCKGSGLLNGCKLTSANTDNLPYHATVTNDGRIHVTGNIVVTGKYSNCLVKEITLTFSDITLTPLKTGEDLVTGTNGKLGTTAALNEPIAGGEIDGSLGPINPETGKPEGTGVADIVNIFGGKLKEALTVSGKGELTEDTRCTYEITAT